MTYEQDGVIVPVLNLNGTSAAQLKAQYLLCRETLRSAITALQEAAPHGRDYPEPGTFREAAAQHRAQLAILQTIYDDLLHILTGIYAQRGAR